MVTHEDIGAFWRNTVTSLSHSVNIGLCIRHLILYLGHGSCSSIVSGHPFCAMLSWVRLLEFTSRVFLSNFWWIRKLHSGSD